MADNRSITSTNKQLTNKIKTSEKANTVKRPIKFKTQAM